MALMYLADTNIFLEILLEQEKREHCKAFLEENIGQVYISDFSLHSIGVALFRLDRKMVFRQFLDDIFPNVELATLAGYQYSLLPSYSETHRLDFDDSYQFAICKSHDLKIATLDKDFKRVDGIVEVLFL